MKQVLYDFGHGVSKWFRSLKRWQRNLIISGIVILCLFWLLVISDVHEWWHWSEWMDHIKNEHMLRGL